MKTFLQGIDPDLVRAFVAEGLPLTLEGLGMVKVTQVWIGMEGELRAHLKIGDGPKAYRIAGVIEIQGPAGLYFRGVGRDGRLLGRQERILLQELLQEMLKPEGALAQLQMQTDADIFLQQIPIHLTKLGSDHASGLIKGTLVGTRERFTAYVDHNMSTGIDPNDKEE